MKLQVCSVIFLFLNQAALASLDLTSAAHVHEFRTQNKMGVGLIVGGPTAGAGVHGELNFEDETAATFDFGSGPNANSFAFGWKQSLEGQFLNPFWGAGFSHWQVEGGSANRINQSAILAQVYSDNDKLKRSSTANFLTGSVGVQYNELSGDLAGASFFGTIDLLVEPQRQKMAPTGSVGAIYFF